YLIEMFHRERRLLAGELGGGGGGGGAAAPKSKTEKGLVGRAPGLKKTTAVGASLLDFFYKLYRPGGEVDGRQFSKLRPCLRLYFNNWPGRPRVGTAAGTHSRSAASCEGCQGSHGLPGDVGTRYVRRRTLQRRHLCRERKLQGQWMSRSA